MRTGKSIFKFIGFIVIFIAQSCADFSIDVPEINEIKNMESFKNKISSKKNNQKTKYISTKKPIEVKDEVKNYWWKKIDSKLLQEKIQILLKKNLGLKVLMSKVRQVTIRKNTNENINYPKINIDLNSSRSKSNNNSYSSSNGYELSSYWELQIFNYQLNKSKSEINATIEEKNALQHLLIADLSKLYVNISYNQKLLALKKSHLKSLNGILSISKKRYESGLQDVSSREIIDVKQEISQNNNLLENIKKEIKEYSYQIDFILGQKVGINDYKKKYLLPKNFEITNPNPNDVISNRPDIKALKSQIEMAGENISIAISDLYPNLSFRSSNGISEDSFEDFFDLNKLTNSIFAKISFKIFARGEIKNNIEVQKQKYKETSYQYAKKILQSFLEVEKGLMLDNFYIKQERQKEKSIALSKDTEKIYKGRYEIGKSSLVDYFRVRQKTTILQQELLRIQQLKWLNYVSLSLALGS